FSRDWSSDVCSSDLFEGLWATADGPDAFVANLERNLSAETFSAHYGYMPEVVALDENRARAIWAMQDYLLWPVDSKAYLGVSVSSEERRVGIVSMLK